MYRDFALSGLEGIREYTFITIMLFIPIIVISIALYMKCFAQLKKDKKNFILFPYIFFIGSLSLVYYKFRLGKIFNGNHI